MDKVKEFLKDWTVRFFRHKDLFLRSIGSIEEGGEGHDIHIKYREKELYIIIEPFAADMESIIRRIKKDTPTALVIFNSKENFDVVMDNWKMINNNPLFSIIFVNPFSSTDTKWVIYPYTHDKITEKASFRTGLKSLFSSVEPVTREIIEKNIK